MTLYSDIAWGKIDLTLSNLFHGLLNCKLGWVRLWWNYKI